MHQSSSTDHAFDHKNQLTDTTMKKRLIENEGSRAALVIRLGLGLVLFPHGAQKLLGWFGGYGFTGTMEYLTGDVGLPWLLGLGVVLLESAGALLLVLGLTTRITALLIGIQFIGIIFTAHLSNGFFMNWEGTQAGEGFEYHLLVIAMSLALLVQGGGSYSLDQWMGNRIRCSRDAREATHRQKMPQRT
jgi:putative oxidoreductase